jgi:hypothetical protein
LPDEDTARSDSSDEDFEELPPLPPLPEEPEPEPRPQSAPAKVPILHSLKRPSISIEVTPPSSHLAPPTPLFQKHLNPEKPFLKSSSASDLVTTLVRVYLCIDIILKILSQHVFSNFIVVQCQTKQKY